eukprot:4998797-Pleurochrysis_carterae.AAC.1
MQSKSCDLEKRDPTCVKMQVGLSDRWKARGPLLLGAGEQRGRGRKVEKTEEARNTVGDGKRRHLAQSRTSRLRTTRLLRKTC